jgi:NAD(P)-dependent dehydrogenase (short-subunit alcohol dehydrogenase family)
MAVDRTLVITGGSRGIGAATARRAAAMGYDVGITFVANEMAANTLVGEITAMGRKAFCVRCDTGDPTQIKQAFTAFDRHFGRLDAFFNNAGVLGPSGRFVDIPLAQLQSLLAINTAGAFIAAQEAVRRMSTRLGGKGGAIVNMSSVAAKLGGAGEATDYAFSKGGIDTLTVGLAKELATEGIRVNAVRPGLIYTEIHDLSGIAGRVDKYKDLVPMKRGGTADEVAEAVLWLLSEKVAYVTGVLLDVAGGRGL